MSYTFKKEETDAIGGYQIVYYYNNMRIKQISETKPDYMAWLAVPNTPEVITFIPPTPPTFAENKIERVNQVDGKTGMLLTVGLEYPISSGKFIHLVQHGFANPQSDYTSLDNLSRKGLLTYPFDISYLDGTSLTINNVTDWDTFFLAVSTRVFSVRLAGRNLITSINGAIDQTALDAIIDTRI